MRAQLRFGALATAVVVACKFRAGSGRNDHGRCTGSRPRCRPVHQAQRGVRGTRDAADLPRLRSDGDRHDVCVGLSRLERALRQARADPAAASSRGSSIPMRNFRTSCSSARSTATTAASADFAARQRGADHERHRLLRPRQPRRVRFKSIRVTGNQPRARRHHPIALVATGDITVDDQVDVTGGLQRLGGRSGVSPAAPRARTRRAARRQGRRQRHARRRWRRRLRERRRQRRARSGLGLRPRRRPAPRSAIRS